MNSNFLRRLPLLWVLMILSACGSMFQEPLEPSATPSSVGPQHSKTSPFGINADLGIRMPSDSDRDRAIQLLKESGVGWVRQEFIWSEIENPKGVFHWDKMDPAVTREQAAGINILGLLDYGAVWWGDQGAPFFDKDVPSPPSSEMLAEWQTYVRKVVQRYGHVIQHWEVWNEPNIAQFWRPVPNASDYAQLLRAAYEVIKTETPQALVVLGGTSGVDTAFIDAVIASGGSQYFDVVAVHPYVGDTNPFSSPERRNLRDYIQPATRHGKPIWLTEIGWFVSLPDGVTENHQARYLLRSNLVALATPLVEKVFWFQFRDGNDPNDWPGNAMGIVSNDLSQPKAGYYALEAMSRSLTGARLTEKVREGEYLNGQIVGDDVYEYRYSKGSDTVIALWKSEGGDVYRPVELLDIQASVADITRPASSDLAPWIVERASVVNGRLTIPVNEMPVFISFTTGQPLPTPPTGVSPPAPIVPPIGTTSESSTVLLLDISGSMGSTWRGGIKMESAKKAAVDLITMMEQEARTSGISHRVGVATFASFAQVDLAPTTDYVLAQSIIDGLFPIDGTNMGEGLRVANQALASEPAPAQRFIILLSDGMTNEGLNPSQILSGPVQDAVNNGTCIHTVGFGDPGDLDENLLREIAAASGCGEYYYASDAYQLSKIYLELRHRSLGQVVASISGEVQQDQVTPPQAFAIPTQQGELNITLTWPGSTLDLVVTDPRGRQVDSSYPGVSLAPYARFVYMIIQNPIPGDWKLSVFGRDVPEGIINYDAVASVRAAPASQGSAFNLGDQALILVAVMALLALVLATVAIVRQSSRPAPARAGVHVQQANGAGARAGFRRNLLGIGRDPRNELVLADDQVSRLHAQIRRETGGYVLYDLQSKNGTFVNGQQTSRCQLHPGDQIRVGNTNLVFFE